jgi:hypothetical protein
VGDITIGKDNLIDRVSGEQSRKFFFRIDGNTFGIMRSSDFWRVVSVGDGRNLSGGKGGNPIGRTTFKEGIKIMKVPAPRSEDNDLDGFLL